MRRREFSALAIGAALAGPISVCAQEPRRPYRIGVLSPGYHATARISPTWEAFEQGLRDLGHVEGRTVTIEWRYAEGKLEALPALAAELVAMNVDVIVVGGPAPVPAAKAATTRIPIVMLGGSSDPVGEGLIASFARPGGNITGLTYAVSAERFGKQLELFREAVGRVSRLAILWDLDIESFRRSWAPALEPAARQLAFEIQAPFVVRNLDDIEQALAAMPRQGTEALLVVAGSINFANRARIAELALRHRLPIMAGFKEFPQTGSLMSYAPNFPAIFRRGAFYVDRILKGTSPADLPVEQPSKYELVINLKTAKALAVSIPPSLIARADEVIE